MCWLEIWGKEAEIKANQTWRLVSVRKFQSGRAVQKLESNLGPSQVATSMRAPAYSGVRTGKQSPQRPGRRLSRRSKGTQLPDFEVYCGCRGLGPMERETQGSRTDGQLRVTSVHKGPLLAS